MEHYEIRVVGHLNERRAAELGCERLRRLPDGHSVLTFAAVDQAALYGLLGRLRDAGLELVAIERGDEPVSPTRSNDMARGCKDLEMNRPAPLREPAGADVGDRRAPRQSPTVLHEGR
jgi:hypothetical protein